MSVFLTVSLNKSAATAYPAYAVARACKRLGRVVGCLMFAAERKSAERIFREAQEKFNTALPPLMPLTSVEDFFIQGAADDFIDEIYARYKLLADCDTVVVEGLTPSNKRPFLFAKNREIAKELNAQVILVIDASEHEPEDVVLHLKTGANEFADVGVAGFVLVRDQADADIFVKKIRELMGENAIPCLGTMPNDKDGDWNSLFADALRDCVDKAETSRVSPAAFRSNMMEQAITANKRIVLPEGAEPRTVAAAVICQNKGIARCVLLADKKEVQQVAEQMNLTLPESLEIINPAEIAQNYVAPLVEMRKAKGMTEEKAAEALQDSVFVGTMMMALDEVDGLVSGAVHTTANTIRPALQVIKTAPDASLVSSVFFMLMPDQVLVYGDCAVNPKPTAAELADIAIQSADSAKAFGIEPRVAMISYSTGNSGTGEDVEKVIEATKLAREKRPDLLIDGPLQYDAASVPSVGKQKAPESKVAGQATVFIFPDLNTGNCTYKAVQRSANVLSVGPMLQGLNKPVNDLSRGALVGDIVYTIALTAIQAEQFKNRPASGTSGVQAA